MNLSLDELRLIAQARNISDYENKSKEDLIKVLSETKPKPEPKIEIKPKPEPKTEIKPKSEPESEPKIEIKVNRKKFKKLRKDFRPYLRDLINEHKPIAELNNDNNRAEWKIQLTMQNSCISTRSFEETRTIYIKSKVLGIFTKISKCTRNIK